MLSAAAAAAAIAAAAAAAATVVSLSEMDGCVAVVTGALT